MSHVTSILKLDNSEAKNFFLRSHSYFSSVLPEYFNFTKLLKSIEKQSGGHPILPLASIDSPIHYDSVNYTIYNNKSGGVTWRPLQLIHPVLYINLVNIVTSYDNWRELKNRIAFFERNENICTESIPIVSKTSRPQDEIMITNWYHHVEQRTLELALDYKYMAQADIANCYKDFQFRLIPWVLHQRAEVIAHPNLLTAGRQIELALTEMSYGRTSGLPQSGELTNFLAEIILCFIDSELTYALQEKHTFAYHIIRYRDDYRIFANDKETLGIILKDLNDILIRLGLCLNDNKTFIVDDIITYAFKKDKYYVLSKRLGLYYQPELHDIFHHNLEKEFLAIREHNKNYPQSGSVARILSEIYEKQIFDLDHSPDEALQMIAIITDMMKLSPRLYCIGTAIISKLMIDFTKSEKLSVVEKIMSKFKNIPNTEFLEIWMQRLTLNISPTILYQSKLCQKVYRGEQVKIWNSTWLKDEFIEDIISESKLASVTPAIPPGTARLFSFGEDRR
ncbi:RNA-directed DNA polymerase [Candidatus Saccharibacteria bacterium]|nr:RNA-directed DNA polymerase [Candidatus Saccharibacteria bacterium]